jgi:tRNA A-37 threonylcarbamoyl transferase component Bud32
LPAVRGVYNQVQAHGDELRGDVRRQKGRFSVPLKYFNNALTYCTVESKDSSDCFEQVKALVEAVDELGQNGVFTADLHANNWGMRGDQPVILDFGVSADPNEEKLPIDLAGRLRRRRRVRRR